MRHNFIPREWFFGVDTHCSQGGHRNTLTCQKKKKFILANKKSIYIIIFKLTCCLS